MHPLYLSYMYFHEQIHLGKNETAGAMEWFYKIKINIFWFCLKKKKGNTDYILLFLVELITT